MKKIRIFRYLLLLTIIISFSACDNDDFYYDNSPPAPPKNVDVFVGDNSVEIQWDFNRESDVVGYNVYFNYTYDGEYTLIGSTSYDVNYFVDYDVNNGEVYYYAVAAFDENQNESELSYDEVYGVPRPQGMNQSIFDYLRFPNSSGYDFSEYLVVPYNEVTDDYSADFFFENFDGTFYLNVWDDSEIQDMGYTDNIYDIPYAPISGWVPLLEGENVKYTQAVIGRTYVILTWDNHFAKVRIKEITTERLIFDWAYQLVEGERQLKRGETPEKRNTVPAYVIKNK
ncbi:MAG: hypothetical protein KJ571_17345 [Bacteroidetes bacterium]|nr:hypothetical protein [Bacteroidota bacterium]